MAHRIEKVPKSLTTCKYVVRRGSSHWRQSPGKLTGAGKLLKTFKRPKRCIGLSSVQRIRATGPTMDLCALCWLTHGCETHKGMHLVILVTPKGKFAHRRDLCDMSDRRNFLSSLPS